MPLQTFWECICTIAKDGDGDVPLADAIYRSAVPDAVAQVELRKMVSDGLVEEIEEGVTLRLTDRGRKLCGELNPGSSSDELLGAADEETV